jgi:hypothetical protein
VGIQGLSSLGARRRHAFTITRNIIIFVTEEKQQSSEQYDDRLSGDLLQWEGPKDHFGESRMLNATQTGDHIHVFYRAKHHSDFEYKGRANVVDCEQHSSKPSKFKLQIVG